jgi:hypothetical protein
MTDLLNRILKWTERDHSIRESTRLGWLGLVFMFAHPAASYIGWVQYDANAAGHGALAFVVFYAAAAVLRALGK